MDSSLRRADTRYQQKVHSGSRPKDIPPFEPSTEEDRQICRTQVLSGLQGIDNRRALTTVEVFALQRHSGMRTLLTIAAALKRFISAVS